MGKPKPHAGFTKKMNGIKIKRMAASISIEPKKMTRVIMPKMVLMM